MKKIITLCTFLLLFATLSWAMDVHFQWSASTGQVDGYRIYHGDIQGGPYPNQLCEVNGTTLGYNAILDETQEYYLICKAFNEYGESGNSNEVHVFHVVPGDPKDFSRIVSVAELLQNLIELTENLGADQIGFISR